MARRRPLRYGSPMAKPGRFCRALTAAIAFVATICAADVACAASRRVALIIGNAAYASLPPLENSVNDAGRLRDTLRDAGFETFYGENLTAFADRGLGTELLPRRRQFRHRAGLLFRPWRAGRRATISSSPSTPNCRRPTTSNSRRSKSATFSIILAAHSRAQVIFLDACRNNPFKIDRFWIGDTLKVGERQDRPCPRELWRRQPDRLLHRARRGRLRRKRPAEPLHIGAGSPHHRAQRGNPTRADAGAA